MTNGEKFKEVFGIDFYKSLADGVLESGWVDEEFNRDIDAMRKRSNKED